MSNTRKRIPTALLVVGGALGALLIGAAVWSVQAHAADKGGPLNPENVFADSPVVKRSWSAFYIGAHGGFGFADTEISAGGFSLDGISAEGLKGGLTAGGNIQFPGTALVLRARANYTWGDVSFDVKPGIFSAAIKEGWSVDAGLGFAMGTAMPYVMAGYTEMKTEANIFGTTLTTPDLKGWRGIAGVEWRLPNMGTGWVIPSLAVEYTYTKFDDQVFGPVTFATHEHAVYGRLNLNFAPGK